MLSLGSSISLQILTGRKLDVLRRTLGSFRHSQYAKPSPLALEPRNSRLLSLRKAQVKSGEAEGIPSNERVFINEETLQRDLEIAIKDEDYAQAAKIRDDLRLLQEDSKAAVLSANNRFYNAFRNGDLAAMNSIWAKGEHVYCVHPGAGRICSYDLVIRSWEIMCGAEHEFPIQIELQDVEVHVRGDIGYVSCLEVVRTRGSSWGKQMATNVFERIDGQWFICVHHASHVDM
ncbi:putative UVR domain, NTF2-like domain superfamily, SnoaL-like domain-containing protein [Dioscorea sansibarensis]